MAFQFYHEDGHKKTPCKYNDLLVVMIFLFGSTKSDRTILNKMYNTYASGACSDQAAVS